MTSKNETLISLSKVVKKNVTLSEESIIDEQAQIEIKDDKTMKLKIVMIRIVIIPIQKIVIRNMNKK